MYVQVEGNLIKWQKWHIRHSFNYREGLVLHDVGCVELCHVLHAVVCCLQLQAATTSTRPQPYLDQACLRLLLSYEDDGRVRPVLHRASLVEMCVPYADPNPPYQRKCAFDVSAQLSGSTSPHHQMLLL